MKFSHFCASATAIILLLAAPLFSIASALPDLQAVTKPVPEPSLPKEWDVFIAPVTSQLPSSNAPTIAEWNRSGGPDDTLILTGDKLSSFTGNDEGKDTQFLLYGQTTQANEVHSAGLIQRLDGAKAAVTLPPSLPPWSFYLLWPGNSGGYGYPVAVNRTEAWWLSSDDKVTRGDTVSIFGRNLAHDNGTGSSWVYLKPAGATAAGQWVQASSVNPYRVQFAVPAAFANGTYEVWIHNGHGGGYGWSGPLSLTITDPYQWNGPTFDVKTYGAVGDGIADDTDAIMKAHAAALAVRGNNETSASPHPTLYFPAGAYMMHSGISLKHDIRYLGAGKALTILRCNAGFQHTTAQGLMYGEASTEHDIEVSNLMLDANQHFSETTFPYDYLLSCTFIKDWKDIHLSNVRIQVPNSGNRVNAASFGTVNRLLITGCEILGGNINLLGGTHVQVDQCSFPFVNDVFTAIYAQSVNGVSITNCDCHDSDINSDAGQGLGRFIILGGYQGAQRNLYIAENKTVDCGPRVGASDQNTGEQILSEGNGVQYEAHPASSTLTTTTFANFPGIPNPRLFQTAVIVKGKGLGQTRLITALSTSSKTITVSPAWNIAPDSTSIVQIAWTTDRCVIYHNSLKGKSDYGTRLTASSGIEPYGGCNEWIVDSNSITAMRYGIYLAGLAQYSTDPVTTSEPCFFHYYANNAIQRCFRGVFYFAEVPMNDKGLPLVSGIRPALLGNTFRKNQWSDLISGGICFDGSITGIPVDMTLFEHNTLTNLPQGINFHSEGHASEAVNTVLYKNTFARGTSASPGSFGANFIASTFSPVLRDNTWTGFENTYAGTLPDAALEIPFRTFALETSDSSPVTAGALVLNSGATPLSWTAASDAAWLTLSVLSGNVGDEGSHTSLTINSNPQNLQAGDYAGTVSISSGTQTKRISVLLTVSPTIVAPKLAKINTLVIAP